MRSPVRDRRTDEGGFTLIELLVVIGILAVISYPLTEAFIQGLKTTDANARDLSRSIAVQAVQSYFTGDVQSATAVSTADPAPTCATGTGVVFLHLSWQDQGRARDISYSVEDLSLTEGQGELVRWSCTEAGPADERMLGLFTFGPGPLPEMVQCDGASCPAAAAVPPVPVPRTITLKIPTNRPVEEGTAATSSIDLAVQRRTT